MKLDKLALSLGFDEEISSVGFIIGPLFLIFAIVLALKAPAPFNYDLLLVAIFGLFLTAKWKIRGCVAALLLLAFSAGAKHVLYPTNHLWQAGLEGSIGIALLISSFVFENSSKWALAKQSELERNEKTILFLEEDLSQEKDRVAKEVAASAEKLATLRSQLEELESQISTFQVLNDVLRKGAAKSIEEKEGALSEIRCFDRRESQLLEEINSLQKELTRIANESGLAQQNKQLFNELNESRASEAQTHLINETLVRLHAKENQKVRESEAKFFELDEEIQKLLSEKANAVREIELLHVQMKSLHEGIRVLEEVRLEKDRLREDLQNKDDEIQKVIFEKENIESEMQFLSSQVKSLQDIGKVCDELRSVAQEKEELFQKEVLEKETAKSEIQALSSQLKSLQAVGKICEELTGTLQKKEELLQKAAIEKMNAHLEIESLSIEIDSLRKIEKALEASKQEKASLENTIHTLEEKLQKAALEMANADRGLELIQADRNELRKELELLQQQSVVPLSEKEDLLVEIRSYRNRLEQYRKLELLYRQLKVQFEEKNQILHETRRSLFHTDTELQTLQQKMDEKELEISPELRDVCSEIAVLEEENCLLLQENLELQDFVSHLMMGSDNPFSVKKKMKKIPAPSYEQTSLF